MRSARRVILPAAVAAGVGAALLVVALLLDPGRTLHGYLAAFAFGISVPIGALFMVMIAHVTNAKWFVVIRRVGETIAATMPAFAVLLIPILIGLRQLYPWVPPLDGLPAHEVEVIRRKAAYLNVPFFVVRSMLYLAVWSGLAWALRRWSLRQDRDASAAPAARALAISGPGIAATGLTVSFAAVDWLMSLSPTWVSTIFGVYWFSGAMLAGVGAITLVVRAFQRAGLFGAEVAEGHYYALGRLLLVFTVFWAYIAFSQGFLIYIADLPHEVSWYLDRVLGGWGVVLAILVFGRFLLPFMLLLSYRLKHSGRWLAPLAAWILLMHYVDMFWLVVPALHGRQAGAHWVDPAAVLAVVGAATAFGAWRMAGEAALPWRDPRLATSIDYRRE